MSDMRLIPTVTPSWNEVLPTDGLIQAFVEAANGDAVFSKEGRVQYVDGHMVVIEGKPYGHDAKPIENKLG